jgi:hypothetical protein
MSRRAEQFAAIAGRDPQSPEEWQSAADAANFLLALDACCQYGLVETTMRIDQDRCDDILKRAKQQGVQPADVYEVLERVGA